MSLRGALRGRPRRDEEDLVSARLAETVKLYKSGLSCQEIASKLGLSGEGVRQRLRAAGASRRSLSAAASGRAPAKGIPARLRRVRARVEKLERELEDAKRLSLVATGMEIRARRKRSKASLAAVAKAMGRSKHHISDIEAGRRSASASFCERFFALF